MDRNSIQRSACGRSLSAQRTARSRGCRKLLFDDRVGLSASPEDRQPDRGYDQNHQSNDSLNWLYPGLVESHAQSAYDYREHNRKVGLREHVVSTGLLNLCKAQRRGGDLPGICQRRPGNRRAGQVLVIHRPSPIPAVLAVLAFPAASTGSPFWVADSVPEPLFFGFRSRPVGTAFVLLPRESDCISRMLFPPLTLGFRELHFSRPVRTALAIAPAAALGFRSRFAYIRAGTEFFIKYLNASFFTPLPSRPQMPAS